LAIAAIKLLGSFELRLATGDIVDLPGAKDRALLAVLALTPGVLTPRERLASLLWSDRGDVQARDSLKHSLTRLRQCFASTSAQPITSDRQAVGLDATALAVDVVSFRALLTEGSAEALERAVTVYRGDLLEGLSVRDPHFEEWLETERRQLRRSAEDCLETLMEMKVKAGAGEGAAVIARRLIALDPLRESASRVLMKVEADRGQATQAIKLYETLRDRLHRELGVEPEAATLQLYESIRRRRLDGRPMADARPASEANEPPGSAPIQLRSSKPSIAVLPFLNLSNDPTQDYFADGIVEEMITALSRMRWLLVISRNSSFAYKGRAVDVKQIGSELGVGYVLEGSVRKAEARLRISGQLVDTATGGHLWADRFEGSLENVFDLQDRITTSVIAAIAPRLEQAEIDRAKRKPANLDAYDYYLRGLACVHQWTREANVEALALFSRSIELDPTFAAAHGMAARCYSQRKSSGWSVDLAHEAQEAERLARRGGELGKDDALALATAGIALAYVAGDLDSGADFTDRAVDLNPNLASGWLFNGLVKIWIGEPDEACRRISRALSLSPQDPHTFNIQGSLAWAYFAARRYREARALAETALREKPDVMFTLCVAAASAAMEGQVEHAQKAMARVRQIVPALRLSNLREFFPTRHDDDFARWRDALQTAGLTE
jgi:TolB-like protein/DNA-binding SARP family transcriptional activator